MKKQTTTRSYTEIRDEHAPMIKCFFAFSKQQFEEGKKEAGILEGEKIYQAEYGLFGTKEGIQTVMDFYEAKSKRIAAECNPQDVYNYEWNNHECMITYDDEEAIKIVVDYFGIEKAKTVKRKYGYWKIEESDKSISI